MTITLPTIYLEKKKTGIAAYREKSGILPSIVRAATSLKTTAVLGATLGTLLTAGSLAPAATGAVLRATPAVAGKVAKSALKLAAPKSIKGAVGLAVGVPVAVGVLTKSKKAREQAAKYLNPIENIKRGEKLGSIIEDPSKAADILGIKDKEKAGFMDYVKTGAKALGVAGVAIGGVAGAKALYEKYKSSKAEKAAQEASNLAGLKQVGFTEPQPVGIGGIPIYSVPTSAEYSGSQPLQSQNATPPVLNIIQIGIR